MDEETAHPSEKGALEGGNEPFGAVVYFQGTSSYTAEIWQTKQVKLSKPLVRYTYWIVITDPNFLGRTIPDSMDNNGCTVDIVFDGPGMRNLVGFQYRHFAGSSFRVRFTLDIETGKVVYQDLNI